MFVIQVFEVDGDKPNFTPKYAVLKSLPNLENIYNDVDGAMNECARLNKLQKLENAREYFNGR